MNHALAAHIRLLETLPRERIRSHQWKGPESFIGSLPHGRSALEVHRLYERLHELRAKGWTVQDMARECHVSKDTARNYLNGKFPGAKR